MHRRIHEDPDWKDVYRGRHAEKKQPIVSIAMPERMDICDQGSTASVTNDDRRPELRAKGAERRTEANGRRREDSLFTVVDLPRCSREPLQRGVSARGFQCNNGKNGNIGADANAVEMKNGAQGRRYR